jgi:hypothetical protein
MNSLSVASFNAKSLHESFEKIRAAVSHRPQLMWISLVVLSGLLAIVWDTSHAATPDAPAVVKTGPTTLENMIPAGFVLVPIQVSNFESLDSILGPYGIVDLFVPANSPGAKALKVASRVKILRAPQNPSQFAVLVEAQASEKLLAQGGAFFAVIQNNKDAGTGIVINNDKPKTHARTSRLIMETTSQ